MGSGNKTDSERKKYSEEFLHKLKDKDKKIYSSGNTFRLKLFRLLHRIWQILFALPFVLIALLLNVLLLLRRIFTGKPVFRGKDIYGKKGYLLHVRYFNVNTLSNMSLFYHVISGKLSLAGYSLNLERSVGDAFIYDYAPGIVNLWFIRSASRTAYEGIKETDKEYIQKGILKAETKPGLKSFFKLIKAEFLLIIRFLIAKIFQSASSDTISQMIDPIYLFNTRVRNISMNEVMKRMLSAIIECRDSENNIELRRKIYFVNPDCFNRTYIPQFADYRKILHNIRKHDWVFADGIGINIAADMMGYPKNENVNGTDLFPRLCEMAKTQKLSLYFLGAKPGIADQMKINIQEQYPGLIVKGAHHGYFDRATESRQIVDEINQLDPDIVLVAFGVPFQERWIKEWFPELKCPVIMGVGGLFDFYSGNMKRAPRWMRDIGLEWVFRLLMEPARMVNRYIIGNPVFLQRVKKLKKTYKWLAYNKIKRLRKKGMSEVLEMQSCEYFTKRHAELLDIMPRLFHFCSKEKIPIICAWQIAPETIRFFQKTFPELLVTDQLKNKNSSFALIIAKRKPQNNELPKNALWLIEPRFCLELDNLRIIPEIR